MEELKKCSFCGSNKVSIRTIEKNHYGFSKYIVASVRCNVCHARGPAIGEDIVTGYYKNEERGGLTFEEAKSKLIGKAKEAWNQRV